MLPITVDGYIPLERAFESGAATSMVELESGASCRNVACSVSPRQSVADRGDPTAVSRHRRSGATHQSADETRYPVRPDPLRPVSSSAAASRTAAAESDAVRLVPEQVGDCRL